MLTKASVQRLVYFVGMMAWFIATGTSGKVYTSHQRAFWWIVALLVVASAFALRHAQARDREFQELGLKNPTELNWWSFALLGAFFVAHLAIRYWL